MNKKLIIVCILVLTFALSACKKKVDDTQSTTMKKDEKINIVATSFHEYDWVSQIIKGQENKFSVTLLRDNGIDLHSYQPTVQDIALISTADMFIYNGGISDAWVEDIVDNTLNKSFVAFGIVDSLGDTIKMEVVVEGMQKTEHNHDHSEHDHAEHEGHDHADHEGHDHADHEGHDHVEHEGHDHAEHDHAEHDEIQTTGHIDEHVWLSLKNAIEVCNLLEDEISKLDPSNKAIYEKNTQEYIKQLAELDKEYQDAVDSSSRQTLIFTDRFPFLYMMNDYGIDYYAAFQGCSAETEASFETISFLSKKVAEHKVNNILIMDNGLEKLATTVINNSKQKNVKPLVLDSLQSVKKSDIESGVTYLTIMQDNLDVLKQALAK